MSGHFPISDPVVVIAVVSAVIVTAPLLLERYRIPGMIGVLIAGAILGPNALGVLARDQAIVLLGTMGLLYIMFSAALEIDLAVLKRSRVRSITFGLFTFGVPMVLGTLMARYLFRFDWPAAVLLASLFASHTLLAYPIASRLGVAKNEAVTTALGGTIFTDTAALLVLAVVASSATGQLDQAFWLRLSASMAVYVAGILLVLPRLARWFFRHIRPDGASEFVFVLAAVFTSASLSHLAGIEPIVGAFLAGLALNRSIPHSSTLMNRINFTGDAIFVPFFLLSVGMLLDVRVFLAGVRSWYISIGMVICVVLSKYLAAELTRIVFRYRHDEGRIIFGLSLAQAAATLAAVMVGHRLEIFDDAVVNGAILMMLVTCIVAPWLVDRHGRKLAMSQVELPSHADRAPQRIMVSLSNADTAPPLVELALLLRDPGQQQPVYPLTVVRDDDQVMDNVAYAEKMLSRAVVHLTAADVASQPVTRVGVNVAAPIRHARKELRVTDVIMGWSGKPSAQQRFFGSFLEHLLEERDYTLWVSRLLHPLSTTSRVVFLVPPHAAHERGFPGAAAEVEQLSRHVGGRLVVVTPAADMASVVSQLRAAAPAVELEQKPLDSWGLLLQRLGKEISDMDLVVLYGAREGSLSWSVALARLPRRLAGHLAGVNLVTVYPAEPAEEPVLMSAGASVDERIPPLPEEQIVMGLDNLSMHDAIETILEEGAASAGPRPSPPLIDALLDSVQELCPGIALLHAAAPEATESMTLVGISRGGIVAPGAGRPLHLLFVLVRPVDADPQAHLNALAEVARLGHEPDLVARVKRAYDVTQIRHLLVRRQARASEAVLGPGQQRDAS